MHLKQFQRDKFKKQQMQLVIWLVINVTKEIDKEILKERYISREQRKKIVDGLGLKWWYNNRISDNNKFVRQYTK